MRLLLASASPARTKLLTDAGISSVSADFLEHYRKVKDLHNIKTYSVLLHYGQNAVLDWVNGEYRKLRPKTVYHFDNRFCRVLAGG